MLPLLKTLRGSLTEPSVYRQASQSSLKSVFAYFLVAFLLLSTLLSSYLTFKFLPSFKTTFQTTAAHLTSIYPPALNLSVHNSQLTVSGLTPPVTFTAPPGANFDHPFLIVIDPNKPPNSVSQSDAFLFASQFALGVAIPGSVSPLIFPYQDLGFDGTINQTQFTENLNSLANQVNGLSPLAVIAALILFIWVTFLPARLLYLLVVVLFLTLLSRLNKTGLTFAQFLKITLVTLIAAETVNLLTTILYLEPTPMVFNLAFIVYTFVGVYSLVRPVKGPVA